MPTNRWVESSFWNFDSLFQPQSHPARDAHDTFFIKEPAATVSWPEEYYERVKSMHEVGGGGSVGYRYDFQRTEASKNLLRTHTTAISSQMLYRLARKMEEDGGTFTPKKYFSIDRVFRNESMDKTHLCEFHQVYTSSLSPSFLSFLYLSCVHVCVCAVECGKHKHPVLTTTVHSCYTVYPCAAWMGRWKVWWLTIT